MKGEFVPVNAVKAHEISSGITPLIINVVTRWKQVTNFTNHPFYPMEENHSSRRIKVWVVRRAGLVA